MENDEWNHNYLYDLLKRITNVFIILFNKYICQ